MLSKNPHYKMSPAEKEVLDDFLSQKQGSQSKRLVRSVSKRSSEKTPVIVRNIVEKTDTLPDEE